MNVNIGGLSDNARKSSIESLNARLADAVALGAAMKQAHWNVKGKTFIAVHELFDRVHANMGEFADTIAERAQTLDGVALGTVEVAAKSTQIRVYPTHLTAAEDHVREISDRLRAFGADIRTAITEAAEVDDQGTADVFTEVSRGVDKDLWFLSSHLG